MLLYANYVVCIPDHEHTSVSSRKKSLRTKEKKSHVLRLKLSDRYSTGVVGCALCIGEKTVNFKFSTEYDIVALDKSMQLLYMRGEEREGERRGREGGREG